MESLATVLDFESLDSKQRIEVRWQQTAGHGGGYQYRLCPASEPLTEACFQAHPLAFANTNHSLRFADPSQDRLISLGTNLGASSYVTSTI